MTQSEFWQIFHAAWGEDAQNKDKNPKYDKDAWIYVQSKVNGYLQKPSEK